MIPVIAIIFIAMAIVIGFLMLSYILQNKHVPKGMALIHGICAATGILLLLIYAITTQHHHKHWGSIIIFAVAAMGGLYLFSRDFRHKHVPKWIVMAHGAIGLTGFTWLLIHLLR